MYIYRPVHLGRFPFRAPRYALKGHPEVETGCDICQRGTNGVSTKGVTAIVLSVSGAALSSEPLNSQAPSAMM